MVSGRPRGQMPLLFFQTALKFHTEFDVAAVGATSNVSCARAKLDPTPMSRRLSSVIFISRPIVFL